MLMVDLKFFHASPHRVNTKEAAVWVGVWIFLAIAFGTSLLFWHPAGTNPAGLHRVAQFFTGYLIEYSLSVDNIFVFIVIFSYFKVPDAYQHQVLFYGILGAIVFRGIFIAAGTGLITHFEWVVYIFGALLIVTAFRIVRGGGPEVDPQKNPVMRFARKRLRTVDSFDGQRLFTRIDSKRVATPLFIVLLVIETSDIIFAVDSIPAIFAVTRSPFIILTSNVFAILGLRALYFLLADTMSKFHLLKYGLALILAFVGVKMLLTHTVDIPIWASLSVILLVLGTTAFVSMKTAPNQPPR